MKATTKKTSNQIISDFLTGNMKVLFTILGVVAVSIIAFGVFSGISDNKQNIMINSTTDLDRLYEDALSSDDAEEFLSYAASIIADFKGKKAELIAYSRLASYYYDKDDFNNAFDYYQLAYTNFPNDIAASVYMFNAAMAKDELGFNDEAIEILELIIIKFKSKDLEVADGSADIPEVIFNLGRLYEAKSDLTKAVEQYEILVAEYQGYNISSLAKTRLLTIK